MNPHYSEKEAAAHCRVSGRTLKRWREEGIGPEYVRMGRRRVVYTGAALAAWIASHTHSSLAAEKAKEMAGAGA
jgi:predicted DNA-binding transcriptional regulator AlpA